MRLPILLLTLLSLGMPIAADPGDYVVDPSHSGVLFRIKHSDVSYFFGRFIAFEGEVTYDPDDPSACSIRITVQAESVRTWSRQRDDHLKGPDFFDVKQFPVLTFESTRVEGLDDDRYRVTGSFSMHGVTREITFEASRTGVGTNHAGDSIVGLYAEVPIRRSEFGITTYVASGGLSDEVRLILSFEAIRS